MIAKIIYNTDTKSFSSALNFDRMRRIEKWKDKAEGIIPIIGISALMSILPAVIKAITKTLGAGVADKLLIQRNNRLNRLTDNYNIKGLEAKTDEASVNKYRQEISSLYEETLRILKSKGDLYEHKDPDLYITVNQDQYGSTRSVSRTPKNKDTVLYQYIDPFIVILKMILIRGVHVLPGTMLGADRRNFELVYDPDHSNPEDVARDSFRTVIFKHKWPSHGFEVSRTGQVEANQLINSCIEFLANNPKYLAIRV